MRSIFHFFIALFIFTNGGAWANSPQISMLKLNKDKTYFFDKLYLPIKHENNRIEQQRQEILSARKYWSKEHRLPSSEESTLFNISKEYGLAKEVLTTEAGWNELLLRVDVVPVSLVLAQAANESAWGKSRFAKDANNYFGQWCYRKGCGLIPLKRPSGASYEVQAFSSIESSIRSYLNNLNTNQAYRLLRELRKEAREKHKALTGIDLAYGLVNYSTRRHSYVKSIQTMIVSNHLNKLDTQHDNFT